MNIDLVVIINKLDETTGFLGINEYPGLACIQAHLKQNGYAPRIHTIPYDGSFSIERWFSICPSLIGFSVYIDNIIPTLDVARIIKQKYPDTHITMGGPQVFDYEKQILKDNCFIDSVVTNEGEETFLELAKRLESKTPLAGCLGLTFREGENIIENPPRAPITNLDALPFTDREIHENVRQKYLYISGSRGCQGGCSFCGETSVKAKSQRPYVRLRSAESVVDEMEYLIKKYQVHSFRMTDATFEDPDIEGYERANKIYDLIIARGLNVGLHLFTRAELVMKEPDSYFEKARKAGVECFYIGIESGNDSDLRLYNKRASVNSNKESIAKILRFGIHVGIGFICFNPFSTYQSLQDNIEFLHSSHLGHVYYLMQTRLELLPQAIIKRKMENSRLISNFDYRSHFYDYEFENKKVAELFAVIKKAYTLPPIYYMDTLLGMDRSWTSQNLDGNTRERIMEMFHELDNICGEYREKNYNFFMECIEMSRNGATKSQMEQLIDKYKLDGIYEPYTNLYNKISVRVSKERIKNNLLQV